jgi:hypothetical protein
MAVYVVPTAMGYSRMITRFVKNKHNFPARPGLMGLVLKVGVTAVLGGVDTGCIHAHCRSTSQHTCTACCHARYCLECVLEGLQRVQTRRPVCYVYACL